MIEVKHLTKRYGKSEVLKDVSLSVKIGEICAVAGVEGAGKTALADLIAGIVESDAGQIVLGGVSMEEAGSTARRQVGYAAARPMLYRDMTPRAAMKFIADAHGMSGREAGDRISATIKKFAIKDVSDTVISHLSEGVRRIVSIAQAAFTGARIIIVDEPTTGLNPKEIFEVREVLRKLKADHAVLLMSRSLTEMCAVADRVLVLHEGRIVSEGMPDQLHRLTMNDGTLHLSVRGALAEVSAAMKGIKNVEVMETAEQDGVCRVVLSANGEDVRAAVFKAVCEKGLILLEMAQGTKPLDDLLNGLISERVVLSAEKEEQDDESGL